MVIDVRPADKIGAKDRAKFEFEFTVALCAQVPGWSFRLVHEPDPILTGNLRWLSGFRHPRHRLSPWLLKLMKVFDRPRPLNRLTCEGADRQQRGLPELWGTEEHGRPAIVIRLRRSCSSMRLERRRSSGRCRVTAGGP